MEFAKKQLEKFGWKEGDGLGKDNQGILSAIKPALKVGKEGMGYDLCKELTDTWWTRAYDDSLKRINVEEDDTSETVGVSLQQDDEDIDTKDETTERPFQKMRKRMMKASFPTFAKGATLSNGEMITEHDNDDDATTSEGESKPITSAKQLTDDELFKACGGRTAHKAARFGLKLNGKLARIAAQEEAAKQALLATQLGNSKSKSYATSHGNDSDSGTSSKKKKKKLRRNDDTAPNSLKSEIETSPDEIVQEQNLDEEVSRKKRKKDKNRKHEVLEETDKDNNSTPHLAEDEHVAQSTSNISKSKKHKKKKSKREMEN